MLHKFGEIFNFKLMLQVFFLSWFQSSVVKVMSVFFLSFFVIFCSQFNDFSMYYHVGSFFEILKKKKCTWAIHKHTYLLLRLFVESSGPHLLILKSLFSSSILQHNNRFQLIFYFINILTEIIGFLKLWPFFFFFFSFLNWLYCSTTNFIFIQLYFCILIINDWYHSLLKKR